LQNDDAIIKAQGMCLVLGVADKLKKHIAAFPVVVVSGARQVGKTTLLRHILPDRSRSS
jgi:predicted AAA+ superfamily ATPase